MNYGNGFLAENVENYPIYYMKKPFCRSVQKALLGIVTQKHKKLSFFMKNGKKGLTNDKKGDKIVNCIIIARTVGFAVSCYNLYSSKLHKKTTDFSQETQ